MILAKEIAASILKELMICELLSARTPHQLGPDLGTDHRRHTQPKNQNKIFSIILFDYLTLDGVNHNIQIYLFG